METSIVNLKDHPALESRDLVRIDRTTRWGNPFVIGKDGDRAQVIRLYRIELWRRINTGEVSLEALAGLDRKQLACWCAPLLPCHGEVLARRHPSHRRRPRPGPRP